MYGAFQIMSQTTLDHPRSKSLMCRWHDRGTIFLLPVQEKPLSALDNAPYFTAFVASSLNAMPSAKADFGGKRMFSPLTAIRSARPPETPNGSRAS